MCYYGNIVANIFYTATIYLYPNIHSQPAAATTKNRSNKPGKITKRQLGQSNKQRKQQAQKQQAKPIHHWSRREGKGTNETAKSNPLAMGLKPSPHQARLDGHEHSQPWTGYEALYEGAQAASASQRALPWKRSALVSRDLWALPTDQLNDPTAREQPPAGMHKAHRANCRSIHSCL